MEKSETIYTYIEDLEAQDKAYNECCRQRREALDIFEQQEITMNEAYTELCRVSNHLLNYLAGDIFDRCIIVFKGGFNCSITSPDTGIDILGKVNAVDIPRDQIMILSEELHSKSINTIKQLFNEIIASKQNFAEIKTKCFSDQNSYTELYRLLLVMIVVLMQDVLDHNIRYELYEHRSGPRLIPRKRASKIIRSCNVLLANKIAVPTTYYDQNQNLGYFENIFRKINTAPRECFSFLVENDIRKEYLEKFINE